MPRSIQEQALKQNLNQHVRADETSEFEGARTCLTRWTDAVAANRIENILLLYAEDAVLVPTLSNEIHATQDGRRRYFEFLLSRNVFGCTVEQEVIRTDPTRGTVAIGGIYTFRFRAEDGGEDLVSAGFCSPSKSLRGTGGSRATIPPAAFEACHDRSHPTKPPITGSPAGQITAGPHSGLSARRLSGRRQVDASERFPQRPGRQRHRGDHQRIRRRAGGPSAGAPGRKPPFSRSRPGACAAPTQPTFTRRCRICKAPTWTDGRALFLVSSSK